MSTSTYTGSISQQTHTYQNNGLYKVRIDNALTSLQMSYSTTFSKIKALKYVKTGSEVESLPAYAFRDAINMVSADFPNVKTIASYTFTNCSSLQNISIPQLSSVGISPTYSLSGCQSLTSIYVNNSTLKSADDGFGHENTTVVTVDGKTLKLASPTLTSYSNTQITSLTLHVFAGSNISSVYLPNLQNGGARTFASSFRGSQLISAEFNALTGTTGTYSFADCQKLQYVKFNDLTAIGGYVFQNCTNLSCVDFSSRSLTTIPTLTTTAFYGCSNISVIVPDSLYSSWSSTAGWTTAITNKQIILVKFSEYSS